MFLTLFSGCKSSENNFFIEDEYIWETFLINE